MNCDLEDLGSKDDSSTVSGRRKSSFALDEFERLDNSTKRGRKNYMYRCKHCKKEMLSDQIKRHLKTKHRDVYRIVQAIHREKVDAKRRVIKKKQNAHFNFKCQICPYSTNFQRRF